MTIAEGQSKQWSMHTRGKWVKQAMQDTANRNGNLGVGKASGSLMNVSPPNVLFSCLATRCHVSIATNCFARLRLVAAPSSPTSAQSPYLTARPAYSRVFFSSPALSLYT